MKKRNGLMENSSLENSGKYEYGMSGKGIREKGEYINLDEWLDSDEEESPDGWASLDEKKSERKGQVPAKAAKIRRTAGSSGYYEKIWKERKRMTLISLIAGALSSFGIMILAAVIGGNMDFGEFMAGLLGFTVIISPSILIIWSIRKGSASGAAMGAGIGFLSSLLTFILSGIRLGAEEGGILLPILFCLSLCGLLFYGAVLLVIALVYAVYIPVSDIYYWVRARQEQREAYEGSSG